MSARLTTVRPADRVAAIAPEIEAAMAPVADKFVDADWPLRMTFVEAWFREVDDAQYEASDVQRTAAGVTVRTQLTYLLELIPGLPIDCFESACLAFLSVNTSWRLAAGKFLEAISTEKVEAMLADHPGIAAILTATTTIKH